MIKSQPCWYSIQQHSCLCDIAELKKCKRVNLIVYFEFLHDSQLHKHPQSCSDHGIHIQREVIKR